MQITYQARPLSIGMLLSPALGPVALHVGRVLLSPLLLAIAALLSIHGIFRQLLPVVLGAPLALALQ